MQHVDFEGSNRVLKKPANWAEETDGPCADLHVFVDTVNACYVSRWQCSWADRLAILFGRPVQLVVKGMQPPVMMQVAPKEGIY